jgi:HEAT repeat protein
VIIVAAYRRAELDRLADKIGNGTVQERIAAVRTLVAKQKLMEALEDRPRWVQDNAIATIALIGTDSAYYEMLTAHDMLDGAVQARDQVILTRLGRRAVEICLEGIQDKDGTTRACAKAPLINVGKAIEAEKPLPDNPVIDGCMSLLDAWDQYVRDGVRDILAGIAPVSPRVCDRLCRIMQQTEPGKKRLADGTLRDQTTQEFMRARGTAEAALVATKVPAIQPIIDQLITFHSPEVRAAACRILGTIGNQTNKNIPPDKAEPIVQPLLDRLNQDDQWAVRRRAAIALGLLKDVAKAKGAVPHLINHLKDFDSVKAACAEALGQIGDLSAAAPMVDTLIYNRRGATRELRLGLTALGPAAIPEIQRALSSGETEVRFIATQALAEIGTKDAVVPLAAMLSDPDVAIRRVAAAALRDIADERVLQQIANALNDPDWQVYHAARDALANVGAPAVPILLTALASPNPRVSSMASEAIVRIGDPALQMLQGALYSGSEIEARWAAIAMGGIGFSAVPYARQVLLDRSAPVNARAMAALALGRTGSRDAIDPLITALANDEEPVKLEAIAALASLADERATGPLVQALLDPSQAVRDAAMDVLRDWRLGKVQEELAKVAAGRDENAARRATILIAELSAVAAHELLEGVTLLGGTEGQKVNVDIARLARTATDPNESAKVRRRAIHALGYVGDQSSLTALTGLLQPGNEYAGFAARAVARIGARLVTVKKGVGAKPELGAAGKTLIDLMMSTKDENLRAQCAAALALMGEQPVQELVKRLGTTAPELKPWVCAALGFVGKPATDQVLDARGTAKDPEVKQWLTASLVLIGDAQALELVRHLSLEEQPNPEKVNAAKAIYEKIQQASTEDQNL